MSEEHELATKLTLSLEHIYELMYVLDRHYRNNTSLGNSVYSEIWELVYEMENNPNWKRDNAFLISKK